MLSAGTGEVIGDARGPDLLTIAAEYVDAPVLSGDGHVQGAIAFQVTDRRRAGGIRADIGRPAGYVAAVGTEGKDLRPTHRFPAAHGRGHVAGADNNVQVTGPLQIGDGGCGPHHLMRDEHRKARTPAAVVAQDPHVSTPVGCASLSGGAVAIKAEHDLGEWVTIQVRDRRR